MKIKHLPLLGLLLLGAENRAHAADIVWAKSWNEAMKQSAAQNKPVMVDFYTDWCGWCTKLDNETYRDARVVKLSKRFISLKLNAEKEGTALAKAYRVDGFPCIVFLDSKGRIINRVNGYLPGADFTTEMKTALARYKPSTAKEKAKTRASAENSAHAKWRKAEIARRAQGKAPATDGVVLQGGGEALVDNGGAMRPVATTVSKTVVRKTVRQ